MLPNTPPFPSREHLDAVFGDRGLYLRPNIAGMPAAALF